MVAGERFEVVGSIFEGPGTHFGGLGVVLAGLEARIEGSVALLDANMAEKSDKRAKQIVKLNVRHPLGQEKWWRRWPQGSQKGGQMDPKWD